jgi:uncharacterized protein YoxC
MNRTHLVVLTVALLCMGQLLPTLQAEEPTLEQVQRYIRMVEPEVARRDARVESLTRQILSLDEDIEYRVNSIMDMLTSVRDSTDSKSRVIGIKTDAIEALEKSIGYYVREREKRLRGLTATRATLSKDDMQHDVKVLNERIDKRIKQVSELTSSFEQHKEFKSYQRYRDYDLNYHSKTPEFKQHERKVTKGAREKARLADEMRKAIDQLRRKNKQLEQSLTPALSEERREALESQIKQNRELMRKRQEQLKSILAGSGGHTKPVATRAAFELSKLFDEITKEIHWDAVRLKSRVKERDTARASAKPLKERLAIARGILAQMESGQQ